MSVAPASTTPLQDAIFGSPSDPLFKRVAKMVDVAVPLAVIEYGLVASNLDNMIFMPQDTLAVQSIKAAIVATIGLVGAEMIANSTGLTAGRLIYSEPADGSAGQGAAQLLGLGNVAGNFGSPLP